jgi:hypothetical protein
MISHSAAGKNRMRVTGVPSRLRRGWSPSMMRHPPISQVECWQPLAKVHRPVTR